MWFVKSPSTQEDIGISALTVDEHFFETLEIQWETSPVRPQDMAPKKQLLINKSGIETLKIAGDPVGQHIDMQEGPSEIVGVTKDFNFIGLQHKIEGMLFAVVPDSMSMAGRGGHLYVRLDPSADLSSKVAAIGQVFKKFDAAAPFDYYFLDEAFSNQYRSERRMGYLFSAFSGVAIFLACLGLFGLAAFAAERRSKEIGVRKVLGATVASITALLAKDFIRLVLLAFFLAIPFAYYFLQRWLADFAYHIEIEWWMFAITGVLAVAIAFLTVSFQSIRAALANPVKSLRNE